MYQKFIIAALVIALPFAAEAQLQNVLNRAHNKVQQRANQKIDKEIDKTLDKAEGKDQPAEKTPVNEKTVVATSASPEPEPALKAFSKYDFIPGDSVIYYEAFEGEALAELPTGWNTSGTGEVTTLSNYPGNWLRLHKSFSYLSSNEKKFGENYTVEFDLILQLKNNGWMYPEFYIGLFSTKDEPNSGNNFLKDHKKYASVITSIYPAENSNSRARVNAYQEYKNYFTGDAKAYEPLQNYYGKPVRVAIQVQKERFRIWINETKMFDVPKAIPAGIIMNQLHFSLSHTNYSEEQYGVFISNIKVATGRPDTRHKLIEEGRFSTTGILFDLQSAVIKPGSYAVIKEIASVLNENSTVKIKVLGHTSSDGDDNTNMELSKKRAAAVKELLVSEFAIDASRIETEGRGETKPVADNKTKEGKALNRRVEFLKL
ncbi:MAG TPA: OmpA family protein [Ferruginibacter sp.]|nr:OmpA family protein [Ferruginibacter sp.]